MAMRWVGQGGSAWLLLLVAAEAEAARVAAPSSSSHAARVAPSGNGGGRPLIRAARRRVSVAACARLCERSHLGDSGTSRESASATHKGTVERMSTHLQPPRLLKINQEKQDDQRRAEDEEELKHQKRAARVPWQPSATVQIEIRAGEANADGGTQHKQQADRALGGQALNMPAIAVNAVVLSQPTRRPNESLSRPHGSAPSSMPKNKAEAKESADAACGIFHFRLLMRLGKYAADRHFDCIAAPCEACRDEYW